MNIVFLGYGEYGAASLSGLSKNSNLFIELVVTHPKKNCVGDNDVSDFAKSKNIPYLESKKLTESLVRQAIESCEPDVIVSTNWRYKIPKEIFSLARLGTLNIHDALLPKYGGLSAEQWVILNGESETGVTVHLVTDQMDTGPIVNQVSFEVFPLDTAETIALKQLEIYPVIISEAIKKLSNPDFMAKEVKITDCYRFHSLTELDAKLKFSSSPEMIRRQMRAWAGKFGGCWLSVSNERFYISEFEFPEMVLSGEPGRVLTHSQEGVWVVTGVCPVTGQSGVIIKELRTENGTVIDAKSILPWGCQLV